MRFVGIFGLVEFRVECSLLFNRLIFIQLMIRKLNRMCRENGHPLYFPVYFPFWDTTVALIKKRFMELNAKK